MKNTLRLVIPLAIALGAVAVLEFAHLEMASVGMLRSTGSVSWTWRPRFYILWGFRCLKIWMEKYYEIFSSNLL